MSLWDWVLAAYERPATPPTCLDLQDAHGLNTSLLLWAAWSGVTDPALLARAAGAVAAWDEAALVPLRQVRRALKPALPPVADAAREALREDVKAAELRAERILVETLEQISGPAARPAPALEAMAAAALAAGRSAPDAALRALAAALA